MAAGRRLRISLLTLGSRGDVEPYLGLGTALARAGHAVTVTVSPAFEELARQAGLEAFPVDPDPRLTADNGGPPRWLRPSSVEGVLRLRRALQRTSGSAGPHRRYLEAARKADVVLFPALLAPLARAIARGQGSTAVPAYLTPLHPTRAFPSPFLNLPAHRIWNRVSHRLTLWLGRSALVGPLNHRRLKFAGLTSAPLDPLPPAGETCLYGFSRHLLPPPADWPEGVVVTGPWWFDAPGDWRPPEGLQRFLQQAGKKVFIGFGSMMDPRPADLNAVVEAALARLGCRAVLLRGPAGQLNLPPSSRWMVVDEVPFAWLFRQVDAVLCHGGVGTVAHAARAGKPLVSIPYFGDQHFWSRRAHQAGVGPPPIARASLTLPWLVSTLDRALHDPACIQRAESLGARVRSEDGVATAVRLIESGRA